MINVEYNQLDPLLRASGFPDGDVNSETGYSPFPGNINQVYVLPVTHFSICFLIFQIWILFKKRVLFMFHLVYGTFSDTVTGGGCHNEHVI